MEVDANKSIFIWGNKASCFIEVMKTKILDLQTYTVFSIINKTPVVFIV